MDNEALVRMVGGNAVETVVSHDIIGRLMIQCARQPGLATVWEQLMGFDGGCSHEGLQGNLLQAYQRLSQSSRPPANLQYSMFSKKYEGFCPKDNFGMWRGYLVPVFGS